MLRLKDGFYAKDENGDVYWYASMPVVKASQWDTSKYDAPEIIGLFIDEDWKDSLYEVKNGFINKIITYEKDQKVLVRNHDLYKWKRRYYSHYEAGSHRVFMDGGTSWSETDTVEFNEIKPYIEGQDEM